jgi:uncharacterized protein YegL
MKWSGLVLVGLGVVACGKSSFKGGATAPIVQEPKRVDHTLTATCDEATGVSRLETQLTGTEKTYVTLTGEFCGLKATDEVAKPVTILFVVDISGSMRTNDPLVQGSCGRFAAFQALSAQLLEQAKVADQVKAGVVVFGDTARVARPVGSLEDISKLNNRDVLCSTLGGATNYEAAFQTSEQTLKDIEGEKVVYFLSDGLPTVSAGSPSSAFNTNPAKAVRDSADAGSAAAKNLQANVTEMAMNAIFLKTGDDALNQIDGLEDFDPGTYLGEIVGSPERVKVVANAEDLAKEIVKFDPPTFKQFEEKSVAAAVTASAGERTLKIVKFEKSGDSWIFATEPFQLFGVNGSVTQNKVRVTVSTSDGEKRQADVVIDFTTKNFD